MNEQMISAFVDAKLHARRAFPEESCGFIVDGTYVPIENVSLDPALHDSTDKGCQCRLCSFRMGDADVMKHLKNAQMVLHSHPYGPMHPSIEDMQGQEMTNLPWGIIALDDERIGDPEIWGGDWPKPALLGREFLHGVRDCYEVIHDTFLAGKDALRDLYITTEWPFDPIELGNMPRANAWWEGDANIYQTEPFKRGWTEVNFADIRPGDCFLTSIRSEKLNHAGVLVSNDLILHHLPGRLSRREPASLWARGARMWLRHDGVSRA